MNETGQPARYTEPVDRTVENMIAAAAHIRDAVTDLVESRRDHGGSATGDEIVALIETIRATYETMIPK